MPSVQPILPSGTTAPQYYVRINPVPNTAGAATDVITEDEATVTVTGVTDEVPIGGAFPNTITLYLLGYEDVNGQPVIEENDVYAQTAPFQGVDTGTKDAIGNELYSWSVQLPTSGVPAGTYVLRTYMSVGGLAQASGATSQVELTETNQGILSSYPFKYLAHDDTEIVSVKPQDTQTTVQVPVSIYSYLTAASITRDGRYVVYTAGDKYEYDLQTGAVIDLSATGTAVPGNLAVDHSSTIIADGHEDGYGNLIEGGSIAYPSFTAGPYTFGGIPDFDFNPAGGADNPLPTVTDSSGATTVLGHFGTPAYNTGYAVAASDNGNAVLTSNLYSVDYSQYGATYGTGVDAQAAVTFLSPAPTLTVTLLSVSGTIALVANSDGTETLTGTSNAIGQVVEVDLGAAGAEVSLATVRDNGTWTAVLGSLAAYTGTDTLYASVLSALGTPSRVSGTFQIIVPPAAPVLTGPTTPADTRSIELTGTAQPDTIVTAYDSDGTVIGTTITYGYQGQVDPSSFTIDVSNLSEGTHTITAIDTYGGSNSAVSAPLTVVIDLTPPTARVTGLTVSGDDKIAVAEQRSGTTAVAGTLSAAPAAGETVIVTDSAGVITTATLGADGRSFTASIATPGDGGTVTAAVQDAAGNQSTVLAQAYTITAVNTLIQRTDQPTQHVSLSDAGTLAAYEQQQGFDAAQTAIPSRVLVTNLVSGTAVDASGGLLETFDPVLSGDGGVVVLLGDNGPLGNPPPQQVYAVRVASDTATLLSAAPVPSPGATQDATISQDGHWAAFAAPGADYGYTTTADATQVFEVDIDTLARRTVSIAGGIPGDNASFSPSLASDGSAVAFVSVADTLVPNAPTTGRAEVYVARFDAAGNETLQLVSTDAQGNPADNDSEAPAISANGRYVAFTSNADDLVPGITDGAQEIYRKDLQTGAVVLVSATAGGTPGDMESDTAAISDDGTVVDFLTNAPSLTGAPAGTFISGQVMQKNLVTGALTLLSSPGLRLAGVSVADLALSGSGVVSAYDGTPPQGSGNVDDQQDLFTSVAVPSAGAVSEDFNGDGKSDLLLQNTNGAIVVETQANLAITNGAYLGTPGPTWHVVGSADFNGDGQADLLLQNDNSTLVDYLLNGTAISAGYNLGTPGTGWHVRGTGDFDRDGKADIVLQNDNGAIVIYNTNGVSLTAGASLGNPGASWTVEGVADVNGDGTPDILLQNTSGQIVAFLMQGDRIASGTYLGNPGAGWAVLGTGDYNGDGEADILLHNDAGPDVIWNTNGATVTSVVSVGNPGASFTGAVAGVDLNGDGATDLVLLNQNSTMVGFTLNSSEQITGGASLGMPGSGWAAVGNDPMQFIDGTSSAAGATIAATVGADQFNFTSFSAGAHFISGFDPAQDAVALSSATFASYSAVQANEVAFQGGTFVALTPGSAGAALIIQGVTPEALSASNFVLR